MKPAIILAFMHPGRHAVLVLTGSIYGCGHFIMSVLATDPDITQKSSSK